MKTYRQLIKTWCTSGPSGAATPPQSPGIEWRVVGFGMASDGHGTYATIVYEMESDTSAESASFARRMQSRVESA